MYYYVKSVYCYKAPKGADPTVQFHSYDEIIYYAEGSGEITIDGTAYAYNKGSVAFVPQGTPCHTIRHSPDETICISFNSYSDKKFLETGMYKATEEQKELIGRIFGESKMYMPSFSEALAHLLALLIISLSRNNVKSEDACFEIADSIQYIRDHIHEKISISSLAKKCNYSPSYYRTRFKKVTGISPSEFLINLRLEKAFILVSFTEKSMSEISTECGFYDESQFSRLFKKEYGISPKSYRIQHHKINPYHATVKIPI